MSNLKKKKANPQIGTTIIVIIVVLILIYIIAKSFFWIALAVVIFLAAAYIYHEFIQVSKNAPVSEEKN